MGSNPVGGTRFQVLELIPIHCDSSKYLHYGVPRHILRYSGEYTTYLKPDFSLPEDAISSDCMSVIARDREVYTPLIAVREPCCKCLLERILWAESRRSSDIGVARSRKNVILLLI